MRILVRKITTSEIWEIIPHLAYMKIMHTEYLVCNKRHYTLSYIIYTYHYMSYHMSYIRTYHFTSLYVYIYTRICVTLAPYIKGPPGTLYCIKAQLAGIYVSARPLTSEGYDRYMLLRKPSLLLGNGDTNHINHAQIRYVWERPRALRVSCFTPLTYLLGMMYVIHTSLYVHMYICLGPILNYWVQGKWVH